MNILLTETRSLTLDLPELPEVAPADASNFARLLRQQLPASTDSVGQVIEYNELYVSTGTSIEAPVENLQQVSAVDWGEFLLPQQPLDAGEIVPDAVTVDLNRALNAPVAAALSAEAGEILPAGGKSLPDVVQSINPAPANGKTATVVPAPMQIPLSAPVEASTIETGIPAALAPTPRPLQLAIAETAVAVMPGPDAKLEIPAEMQRAAKIPAAATATAASLSAPVTVVASAGKAAVPAEATRAAVDGLDIAVLKPGLAGQAVTPETATPKPAVTDTPLPTPLQVTPRRQDLNPAPTTATGETMRPPAPTELRSAIDSNLPGGTGNREQSMPTPAAESRPASDALARAQRDPGITPRDPVEVKAVDGSQLPAQTPARGDGQRAIELRDLAPVLTQQPIAQSETISQQVAASRAPEANLNTTTPALINTAAVASAAAPAVSQASAPVTGDTLPPQLEILQLSRQGDAREWGSGLGERVQWMINQKQNMATIRLDPPALGKLDVQVRIVDDSATITIQTQLPQTRDLIDAASQRLRDFLQDSGYQNVNVDVSQRQDQQQARSHSGSPADAEQGPESDSERLLDDSPESVSHGYLEGDGLLDTFA